MFRLFINDKGLVQGRQGLFLKRIAKLEDNEHACEQTQGDTSEDTGNRLYRELVEHKHGNSRQYTVAGGKD